MAVGAETAGRQDKVVRQARGSAPMSEAAVVEAAAMAAAVVEAAAITPQRAEQGGTPGR